MKEYAKEFYSSGAWKLCRANYTKSKQGLCERCLQAGKYSAGVVVHHIIPITPENINDPEITLSFNNLMLLCVQCHADMHSGKGDRRYVTDEEGHVYPLR